MIVLTEYLTDNFKFTTYTSAIEILGEADQDIYCALDLRGLTLDYVIMIAQLFANAVFTLKKKPTAYVLLIDDLTGADIHHRTLV